MPFVLLIVGAVLVVAGIRGTEGQLGTALSQDAGGFTKWAVAVMAVGALGFVPELRGVSRWLLALVLVVLVVTNYKKALAGVTSLSGLPAASSTNVSSGILGAIPASSETLMTALNLF